MSTLASIVSNAQTEGPNSTTEWTNATGPSITEQPDEAQGSSLPPNKKLMQKIVTYVGAGIALVGIFMTLISYIGYRKFNVKRPHIVMVNLCFCLFLYYLAYLISNPERQMPDVAHGNLCLFGAILLHFSALAAWFWILVYWILILVMLRRPVGGHISHFFIKASIPSYAVPLLITIISLVVAHYRGEMKEIYYGNVCVVDRTYRDLGAFLPFALLFLPMLVIFVLFMRDVVCTDDTNTSRKNLKRQFIRLSIITLLLGTAFSSGFVQLERPYQNFTSMMIFGIVSSVLGLALMVLFCLHHDDIRQHWLSVIRGEDSAMRKHSISRSKYEVGEMSTMRKSSTLKGTPSVYIESYDDERKSSTYRMVAKEDTDMSTLGLIQIPGTPSPSRIHDSNDNPATEGGGKVKRKKSDASKAKMLDKGIKSPKRRTSLDEIKEGEIADKKQRKKHRAQSSSTPPASPAKLRKSTKRQLTSDDLLGSGNSSYATSTQQNGTKRPSKRGNPGHRLSRFSRKSTSTLDDDTVQLTDFK